MSIKLIVPLQGVRDPRGVRNRLLKHSIDYTHILECMLAHWNELNELDSEELSIVLELALRQLLRRKIQRVEFGEFMETLMALRDAITQMHHVLVPIINPILDGIDPRYKPILEFKRFLGRSPVVEVRVVER